MKVICLNGSPRKKGSTAEMLRILSTEITESGNEVSTIELNPLNYKGCQGCMACKGKTDHCVLTDDLAPVLEEVKSADILVLGTPIYFGEVTAQMKAFIDRTFSYLTPGFMSSKEPSRLSPGKTLIMVLPQGAPDKNAFSDVFPRYSGFYKYFGFDKTIEIRGLGIGDPEDIAKQPDLIELIKDKAKSAVAE